MQRLVRNLLALAAALFGLWWMLVVLTLPLGQRNFAPYFNIASIVLSPFLATVVHEVGHAAAGALVGYRIRRIEFGPFLVNFENGFHISFGPRTDLGGYVAALAGGKGPANLLVLAAGGPLANLATSLIVFLAVPLSNWSAPLAWGVGLYSLAFGVYSLWPKASDTYRSDGQVISEALRALSTRRSN